MKKLYKITIILVILLVIGSLAMAQQSDNQSNTPAREDIVTTELPSTVVYLIDEDSINDTVDEAAAINSRLDAVTLHNWDDYLQFDNLFFVEAIILHPSALDFVDNEVITAAYERGVVISALNTPNERFIELIDNPLYDDRYQLIEGDVVYIVAYSFETISSRSGGSTVGRFGDEIEAEAFAISLFLDIEGSRQNRLDALDLNNDD